MTIHDVTMDMVASVYSGMNGKCCCGCAGKHSYNPTNVTASAERRGYPILAEEISTKKVQWALRKLQRDSNTEFIGEKCFTLEVGSRVHIVYLV